MSNKTLRQITRLIHVLAGLSFPLLVYTPLIVNDAFLTFTRILVPLTILSGVVMWQQPRISSWRKPTRAQ